MRFLFKRISLKLLYGLRVFSSFSIFYEKLSGLINYCLSLCFYKYLKFIVRLSGSLNYSLSISVAVRADCQGYHALDSHLSGAFILSFSNISYFYD